MYQSVIEYRKLKARKAKASLLYYGVLKIPVAITKYVKSGDTNCTTYTSLRIYHYQNLERLFSIGMLALCIENGKAIVGHLQNVEIGHC